MVQFKDHKNAASLHCVLLFVACFMRNGAGVMNAAFLRRSVLQGLMLCGYSPYKHHKDV